jgi:hypothetical protein
VTSLIYDIVGGYPYSPDFHFNQRARHTNLRAHNIPNRAFHLIHNQTRYSSTSNDFITDLYSHSIPMNNIIHPSTQSQPTKDLGINRRAHPCHPCHPPTRSNASRGKQSKAPHFPFHPSLSIITRAVMPMSAFILKFEAWLLPPSVFVSRSAKKKKHACRPSISQRASFVRRKC